MFNRVSYQATPSSHNHRRTKTEGNLHDYDGNPEYKERENSNQVGKNLNKIEINLLPPQHSISNLPTKM